ncbi:MAG TPA: hypothetical protein VFY23_01780 [Candidatus Limnocylindrales bacterium]|nr:hypothetical protein [Candidatus Limnocylindrales bacterium]
MEVEGTVRTRRAVLVGAAGGVAAAVAHALGRPAPAWAVSDPLMTEVLNNTTAQTGIASAQTTPSSAVFAAYAQGNARVYALFGQASGPGAFGAYAYHETTGVAIGARSTDGIGVVGAVGGTDPDRPMERTGVFGSGPDCGVYGSGAKGVYGTGSDTGVGVYGVADAVGAIGTEGSSLEGRGVRGSTGVGIGVEAFAESPDGKALRVAGKARFTRSGRATVLKNKSSVDVDLRARGGLSSSSLCFATLATSRTGAWVRTVRPNYPSTGYMRIYLNKVASTTSSTYVSWIVFENS